ncbi:MAG: S8 family serine peptidase [Candidatus Eisenbacteria bacterium]
MLRAHGLVVIVLAAGVASVSCPASATADRIVFALRPVSPVAGAGGRAPAPAAHPGHAQDGRLPAALETRWPTDAVLHRFDEGLSPPSIAASPDESTDSPGDPNPWRLDRTRVWMLDLADSAETTVALATLASDPAVAWAERDQPREPCVWRGARTAHPLPPIATGTTGDASVASTPLDPLLDDGRQWGLDNRGADGPAGGLLHADIHAPGAWSWSRGGADVWLAVADTGVDPAHPDLAGTLDGGDPRIVFGFDATLTPGQGPDDSLGHGTRVAGVMAARTGDGAHYDSLGIAGVCGGDGDANPGCRLIPVRICPGHSGVAHASDEARGIAWAVDHGARVINLSFAATAPSTLERLAVLDALARGTLVVCAAGNRGLDRPGLPMYPAALAGDGLCMSVGASDAWDRRVEWSSDGAWLDLVAPGVDIWSTALTHPDAFGIPGARYAADSGTSFAAPFASGTAGLMLALRPDLDAADLAPLMRANADDIGAPGPDSLTGAGRLDAWGTLADLAPGDACIHGVAAPIVTTVEHDTLALGESGQPLMDALGRRAAVARVTVTATIAVPDSLLAPVRAWVRVAASTTMRPARTLPWVSPWADVTSLTADVLTLSGTLYRIEDARLDPGAITDTMQLWLPVPPERARIAYTLWGRVHPVPTAAGPGSGAGPRAPRIAAVPNPFATTTRLVGRPGDTIELFDTTGRRVRVLRLSSAGEAAWDGRDDTGRALPSGLYLARASSGGTGRAVRLE